MNPSASRAPRWYAAGLAALVTSGCAIPTQPKPDYAAIKPLLRPCPIAEPRRYTAHEVTRVGNARKDALIQCNKDKAAALEKLEKP